MIIILDLGSGETCKNQLSQVKDMITVINDVDNRKHEIILKWQLFRKWGDLRPLHPGVFQEALHFARLFGYATTASVFDVESARFLLEFPVPFVKIASVESLLNIIGDIPLNAGYWNTAVVASYSTTEHKRKLEGLGLTNLLACIREYPAQVDDYEERHSAESMAAGLSDHTDHSKGMYLFNTYRPRIYETHFCLDTQDGPDTGPFALRPAQLRKVLES